MNFDFIEKRRNEQIFIIAYLLFILKNLFPVSSLFHYSQLLDFFLTLLFIVCIGYKLITQKYNRTGFVLIAVLTLLFAYTALTTKYYSIFYGWLCVISMQNVSLTKVLKASSTVKAVYIFLHVLVYAGTALLRPEMIELIERNGVLRHFFFLQHPNLFSALVVWTCLEIIYIHYKQMTLSKLLVVFLINLFFYLFTNSNTGLIVLSLVIVMIIFEKRKGAGFQRFLSFGARFINPILGSFFIFLAVIYTQLNGASLAFWTFLDDALTGRLLYGAYAFNVYGFSVLGRGISFPEKSFWEGFWLDEIYFDNSYLYLFILYGSIYFVIISAALYLFSKKMEPIEKILIMGLALFGSMEGYMLNISICFPLVIVGRYIYDWSLARKELVKWRRKSA